MYLHVVNSTLVSVLQLRNSYPFYGNNTYIHTQVHYIGVCPIFNKSAMRSFNENYDIRSCWLRI